MKWCLMFMLAVSLCSGSTVWAAPTAAEALKNLKPHPRLMLTDTRLVELKSAAQSDTVLRRYVADVIQTADTFLLAPPFEYKMTNGLNLLLVSRAVKLHVMTLAFAYRWTADTRYMDKTVNIMDTVCGFKDWFPGHYLDAAEMGFAVSVGYDWLYDRLTPEQRAFYRKNMDRCMFAPNYAGKLKSPGLWGAICNGSLTAAALAVAEDNPVLAEKILAQTRDNMKIPMNGFMPDGVCYESAYYWNVIMENFVYGIASLESAVGTNFDWDEIKGVPEAGFAALHTVAPSFYPMRYADIPECRMNLSDRPVHPNLWQLFYLGNCYKRPEWVAFEHDSLKNKPAHVMHVVLYRSVQNAPAIPVGKRFGGKAELVTVRTEWFNPNSAWLAVKAGANNASHGHVDAGNFEYEVEGVRWVYDIGQDDYGLKGYFGKERPTYYRTGAEGHSLMVINGQRQSPAGKGRIADFSESDKTVTVDLVDAYKMTELKTYSRHFMIKKSVMEMTEHLILSDIFPLQWAMITDAEIEVLPNAKARLTCKGKSLIVSIMEPKGMTFAFESCQRKPPEMPNTGFKRLYFDTKSLKGKDTMFRIRFEPESVKK